MDPALCSVEPTGPQLWSMAPLTWRPESHSWRLSAKSAAPKAWRPPRAVREDGEPGQAGLAQASPRGHPQPAPAPSTPERRGPNSQLTREGRGLGVGSARGVAGADSAGGPEGLRRGAKAGLETHCFLGLRKARDEGGDLVGGDSVGDGRCSERKWAGILEARRRSVRRTSPGRCARDAGRPHASLGRRLQGPPRGAGSLQAQPLEGAQSSQEH